MIVDEAPPRVPTRHTISRPQLACLLRHARRGGTWRHGFGEGRPEGSTFRSMVKVGLLEHAVVVHELGPCRTITTLSRTGWLVVSAYRWGWTAHANRARNRNHR